MDSSRKTTAPLAIQDGRQQELQYISLLAGNIVHSFNNAIGVIKGYADLSLRSENLDDSVHEYLNLIIEAADSARQQAGKLMVFTKQESPDYQLTGVQAIIEQAINDFLESLEGTAAIKKNIDPTCGAVQADAEQILSTVMILCNNAYEAMRDSGGLIEIILKETDVDASLARVHQGFDEGRYAKLTVKDTGKGMDEETLTRIFEPFFTTKKAGEHAGLGCAVVREIAKRHKGAVMAESKPGEGSTFDVYLPLAGNDNDQKGG